MGQCKRYTVIALAITASGEKYTIKSNYNEGECTGEPGNCGCIHAEVRVLRDLEGENIQTVIVTHSPCEDCAKALIDAGVKTVGYLKEYRIRAGLDLLIQNGVTLIDMTDFLKGVEL